MKFPLILLVALVASGNAANIDGPEFGIKELDDLNQELDDFIFEDDDEEEDEFDEEDEEQSSLVRALPFLRAPTCDGRIKKSCSKNGGYCVLKPFKSNCKGGTLDKKACKSESCRCCIPASPNTTPTAHWPTYPDVPDNKLQPYIKISEEHIKWEQPGAFFTWNTMEQDYSLTLAHGPGNEEEFVYIQRFYDNPGLNSGLINVCDLQYGSYKIDHGRKGVFFVYHNRTQKPDQKLFGLKANGIDQKIQNYLHVSPSSSTFPGTDTSSSFWNFHWIFGQSLKNVDCDEQASTTTEAAPTPPKTTLPPPPPPTTPPPPPPTTPQPPPLPSALPQAPTTQVSTDGKITTPAKSATTEAAPTP